MKSHKIRQRFVDYYQSLGFSHLKRASMLHPSIPMSFVMSAGLVQVETSLTSTKERAGNQFVLVQQCFRHFDLDRVGEDCTHLSLFEMPGSFVFGPESKRLTIERMWQVATEVLEIPTDRIWVSYFKGDHVLGHKLEEDQETYKAWIEVGVQRSHIIGLGGDDNYWVQGGGIDQDEFLRKCGPNTELFYDRGSEYACSDRCTPGCKCGRFIEFSNSLFISGQIDIEDNEIRPLPDPFAETVIGTERVAMFTQKVETVFHTDVFLPIVKSIRNFDYSKNPSAKDRLSSERVIADHLRALYVLVADGAPPPGKNGRERIVKLLIRGVVTHQIVLGIESKTFPSVVLESIANTMPEFDDVRISTIDTVDTYFQEEARKFRRTIKRGLRKLSNMLTGSTQQDSDTLNGTQVVTLEKSFGLPVDLIAVALRKKDLPFPRVEYENALAIWRQQRHN